MKIRNLIMATCAITAFTSCEKDPDFDELDANLTVYTDYDPTAVFADYDTYYIPDSILEASGNHAQYWKDENADELISAVNYNMKNFGYSRVNDKEDAKIGLQLSYLSQNRQVTTGGYYPGWWDFGFWGPWWSGWYYPYTTTYNYSTNSFIIEMVDLTKKSESESNSRKLPVIWIADAYGFRYSNGKYNLKLIEEGISRAFGQSQYLNRK